MSTSLEGQKNKKNPSTKKEQQAKQSVKQVAKSSDSKPDGTKPSDDKSQKHKQSQPASNLRQSHKQIEMRRIGERQQLPSDKSELIEYLSERIKRAEQALNDTQEVLEGEITQRQKIMESLSQRNRQLEGLYEVDQKALPEKIKEKLTEILTQTINQKLQAEEELTQEKMRNYEYTSRYAQLDIEGQRLQHSLQQLAGKETLLNREIHAKEQNVARHEKELHELEEELSTLKDKKEKLQDRYLQMKVALQRMTDVKAVLNRFFSNEDLFDDKMELKQQQVQRPTVSEQQNRPELPSQHKPPSRLPSRQNRNTTKLKPLNNSRKKQQVDEDDFWRGDFSTKTRKG